ncbi:hypothetical protein [Sulfuriroseicoccus oceanibius]|uniref:Uncharacterized protein n=1 Tax=Sulfuriroseicoccus oceanibius TaxID=2707525 RepID=A0A6B3LF50_9BACT|nr:hypothetical protein [Sulfuriroseicoccus oceanibius]QQL45470.1 hypothetical protein G3M56_002435 [Sulfuriroseicoccus oceanibius]
MNRPTFLSDQHPQFRPSAAGEPLDIGLIPPGLKMPKALKWFERIHPPADLYCCQITKQKGAVQRNQSHFLDNAPAIRFIYGPSARRWETADTARDVRYWLWLGNPAWRMVSSFRNFQKNHPVSSEREIACDMTLGEFLNHQISSPLHNRQAHFLNLDSSTAIDSWFSQSVRWVGLEDQEAASLQAMESIFQSELKGWRLNEGSPPPFKAPSNLELTHEDLEALRRHCDLDIHLYQLACAKLGVSPAINL